MQDFFYQQYEPVFVADDKAWDSVSQASTVPGTPSTVRPLMISFPFAQCNDDRLIQHKIYSLIYLLIYLCSKSNNVYCRKGVLTPC